MGGHLSTAPALTRYNTAAKMLLQPALSAQYNILLILEALCTTSPEN